MASTREAPCARVASPSVAFCSGTMKFCAVPAHLAALAVACGSPPAPASLAACAERLCMWRLLPTILAAAEALVITR